MRQTWGTRNANNVPNPIDDNTGNDADNAGVGEQQDEDTDSDEDDGAPERTEDYEHSDDESTVEFQNEEPRNVFNDPDIWERPRRSEAATRRDILTYDKRGEPATQNYQTKQQDTTRAEFEDIFSEEELDRLEQLHMLCAQTSINPEYDEEYDSDMASLMAMIMTDINARASADGVSFAQQHILHEGLKLFKE